MKVLTKFLGAMLLAYCCVGYAKPPEPYPNKAITLVVPFAAGGPTDVVARMLAIPMGQSLGQTVLVENIPVSRTQCAKKSRPKPTSHT